MDQEPLQMFYVGVGELDAKKKEETETKSTSTVILSNKAKSSTRNSFCSS